LPFKPITYNLSSGKTGFKVCLSSTQPAALQRGGGQEELSEAVQKHMVRAYLASVTYTDENIGKVLAALEKYPVGHVV
jgi:arylsulfatase A-like enzyme